MNRPESPGDAPRAEPPAVATDPATPADAALADVVATVDLSRDALIVVADHGHSDRGGHGGFDLLRGLALRRRQHDRRGVFGLRHGLVDLTLNALGRVEGHGIGIFDVVY